MFNLLFDIKWYYICLKVIKTDNKIFEMNQNFIIQIVVKIYPLLTSQTDLGNIHIFFCNTENVFIITFKCFNNSCRITILTDKS